MYLAHAALVTPSTDFHQWKIKPDEQQSRLFVAVKKTLVFSFPSTHEQLCLKQLASLILKESWGLFMSCFSF